MSPRYSLAVRAALIMAVFAVAGWALDWSRLAGRINAEFLFGILAAQPFILASTAIQSWRHALLISDPPPPFRAAFCGFILATGLNNLLPARSGELVKASYLHAHYGIPVGVGLAAVTVERLLDILMLLLMAVASMTVITLDGRWAWIPALLIPFIALGMAIVPSRLGRLEEGLARWLGQRRWPVIAGVVLPMLRHARTHMSGRRLAGMALLTAAAWIVGAGFYAVFLGLAGDGFPTLTSCAMLVVVTAVGIAIPILPSGLVTFEGAAVLALTANGYDLNSAFALAIGLRLCMWCTILPLSMLILARRGTGLGSVMRMARGHGAQPATLVAREENS